MQGDGGINNFLCGKKTGSLSPIRLRRSTQFPAASRFSLTASEDAQLERVQSRHEFKMRDAAKLIWRKVASFLQFQAFKEPLFNGQLQQTRHWG